MTSVSTDRRQGVNAGAAVKVPVRTATTADITLNGLQTIDGVVLVQDDRVLVKDQTDATENGIYRADSGDWQRDVDFDGPFDVKEGTFVYVTDGVTTIGFWYVTTADPIIPDGSTSIAFAQASTVLAVLSAFWQSVIGLATAALSRTALGSSAVGDAVFVAANAAAARATLGAVSLTGNETIAGIKTLSSNPIVAGGGVQFPATQVPSADANCLDDYEEGTWTPTLTFSTPGNLNVAYGGNQTGVYRKIGGICHVWFAIITSTFTHTTASGNLHIGGLPFVQFSSAGYPGAFYFQGITKANYTQFTVSPASSVFTVDAAGSAQNYANVTAADMPTGGTVHLVGSGCYAQN